MPATPTDRPAETVPVPHDRAFWRSAVGRRRPDGTMADGPASFGSIFRSWVGIPSRETRERAEREAKRTDAREAAAARSAARRKAIPAPRPAAQIPHPRTCRKAVRAIGRAA